MPVVRTAGKCLTAALHAQKLIACAKDSRSNAHRVPDVLRLHRAEVKREPLLLTPAGPKLCCLLS